MGLRSSLNSAFSKTGVLRATFDIRVLFFLGGLCFAGYGLYLNFSLGTSLIFVGVVLMVVGWVMEDRK